MSLLSQFFSSGGVDTIDVELVLVGGGGGGDAIRSNSSSPGGGGGAGQVRYFSVELRRNYTYNIIIGSGGDGAVYGSSTPASNGGITRFGNYLGYGGQGAGNSTKTFGSTSGVYATTDNRVLIQPSQDSFGFSLQNSGNRGFFNEYDVTTFNPDGPIAGGGGGAGGPNPIGVLGSQYTNTSGDGHLGISLEFIGYPDIFLGGGGGGAGSSTNDSARGYSQHGGGSGGSYRNPPGNGGSGTGGGGGGAYGVAVSNQNWKNGGDGGSGVVYVRYSNTNPLATVSGNDNSLPTQPGYRTYRWIGNGSIRFN